MVSEFAPGGQRAYPGQAGGCRRQAGAAAAGRRRACARASRPIAGLAERIERAHPRVRWFSARASSSCPSAASTAANTSPNWSGTETDRMGGSPCGNFSRQGVHHITLVGADRQTSIDFWEGVLGMPFIFEQPNLDKATESHLYFDPGDGRLITVFTDESRKPDPSAHADRYRLRPPHRLLGLARDFPAGGRRGSTSARSSTAASRIAASWIRSISRIRSAC